MTALALHSPVSAIKGIGTKKENILKKLEVFTVEDLLYYFPRKYEDRRNKVKISELTEGRPSVIKGKVISKENPNRYGGNKAPFKLTVKDETGTIEMIFFKANYLNKLFQTGNEYIFFGVPSKNMGRLQIIHPEFSSPGESPEHDIMPVYRLTEGLSQKDLRKWMEKLIHLIPDIREYLPEPTIDRNNLCGIGYALSNIHFPKSKKEYNEARYRLIFEELLELRLGLTLMKNHSSAKPDGIVFNKSVNINVFTEMLDFELTGAQNRVIGEIMNDMENIRPMNRLVQGDVGSGKTVVAAAAMYKAVKSGYQAVMMAPTEILARQHFEELSRLFYEFRINVSFLSGSIKGKERQDILKNLSEGKIDIIIGTHALIQDDVSYKNLGLAITDEQHRFGVRQRVNLSEKGSYADVLVMTATPIPRTLAFILYGDLDISVIDEMPPGRQMIKTEYVNGKGRSGVYESIKRQIDMGRQAYVVAPLIEDSDVLEQLKSAEGLIKELKKEFKGYSLDLLHGGMKQTEKDDIMDRFYRGEIQILVSTVVIEVGINVKNATIMVIENAERFGLAQLHQLRGRVGRGEHQSYCILISDSKTEEAVERLELMTSTNNGFEISEKDLEMRGPGDMFGSRQHGLPQLRLSDLVKNVNIMETIRQEAKKILIQDPNLVNEENTYLRKKIEQMFGPERAIGL